MLAALKTLGQSMKEGMLRPHALRIPSIQIVDAKLMALLKLLMELPGSPHYTTFNAGLKMANDLRPRNVKYYGACSSLYK